MNLPDHALYTLVAALNSAIHPLFGPLSAALAIVLFTILIRLALLPLAIRAASGEKARARLQPRVKALMQRHRRDPERQKREIQALYAAEGVSPFTGFLPVLAQWPVFAVLYSVFRSKVVAGHRNVLLAHTLLGAPLDQSLLGTVSVYGLISPQTLVFVGLLGAIAGVAWWSSRKLTGVLRLTPYVTVLFAAFTPLAAATYLVTTTTWTAVERAVLRRDLALAA
jgi:YidC/Oxa1 family membrane protein insertase